MGKAASQSALENEPEFEEAVDGPVILNVGHAGDALHAETMKDIPRDVANASDLQRSERYNRHIHILPVEVIEHEDRDQLFALGHGQADKRESHGHAERVLHGAAGALIVLSDGLPHPMPIDPASNRTSNDAMRTSGVIDPSAVVSW